MTNKQIAICEKVEWYDKYLDDGWMKMVDEKSASTPDIQPLWHDLMYDLRSYYYVAKFPKMFPDSAAAIIAGARIGKGFSLQPAIAEALIHRLKQEMPFFGNRPEDIKSIYRILDQIDQDIQREKLVAELETRNKLWELMISQNVMQMSIHGIMKMAYLAVYGSYENFLVRNVSRKLGEVVRVVQRDFKDKVELAYGNSGCNVLWLNSDFATHRDYRNILTHASGIVPKDKPHLLKHKDYKVMDSDNRVQIMPHNIKILFSHICPAIEYIIDNP